MHINRFDSAQTCQDGWMNRCMAELERERHRQSQITPTDPLFSVRLHGKGGCCVRESAVEG